jgi:hypothetical protein
MSPCIRFNKQSSFGAHEECATAHRFSSKALAYHLGVFSDQQVLRSISVATARGRLGERPASDYATCAGTSSSAFFTFNHWHHGDFTHGWIETTGGHGGT